MNPSVENTHPNLYQTPPQNTTLTDNSTEEILRPSNRHVPHPLVVICDTSPNPATHSVETQFISRTKFNPSVYPMGTPFQGLDINVESICSR